MRTVQSTYEAYVAERRAYGWIPLDYETWLAWYLYDEQRLNNESSQLHHQIRPSLGDSSDQVIPL